MQDKILGVLYGMAIGDAMGMPPELWTRRKLLETYGNIDDFLDGHPDNVISNQYKRGHFTDDTAQSLEILNSLIETDFKPDPTNIANHILAWAKRENAFEKNILGPTSKLTLELFEQGRDCKHISDVALSNGAAMRITPIGTLFLPCQKRQLVDYVYAISHITHSSDVTIAGACMVAEAVSSVLEKADREEMIKDVLEIEEYALSLGAETVSASLSTRVKYAINLANKHHGNDDAFLDEIYKLFGAGVNVVDSVPPAIAIAYYAFTPEHAALLSANLGGDTDTIGAMATAICGGIKGVEYIDKEYISLIDRMNNVDFRFYADKLYEKRSLV